MNSVENTGQHTGQEQRITFQLYQYWFDIAANNGIPPLTALKPEIIDPYRNNMVLINLQSQDEEPTLQIIGDLLNDDIGTTEEIKYVSDVPRRTLLSRITDHYMEVLGNKSPISFDAEFKNKAGEIILYRGILLPFSDDSENINFILGAIRWISEEEMIRTREENTARAHKIFKNMPTLATFDLNDTPDNNPDNEQEYHLLLARRSGQKMDVIRVLKDEEILIHPMLDRIAKDIE